MQYWTALHSSALQVYHSAVVTMPACLLWEEDARRCTGIPRLRSQRLSFWSREQRIFEAHYDAVRSIAIAPDGRVIVSATSGGVVKVWDTITGMHWGKSLESTGRVCSVAVSSDGQRVLGVAGDSRGVCTLEAWDIATGVQKSAMVMTSHPEGVTSVAFSPDSHLIAAGFSDGTIQVWDAATGARQCMLTGHGDAVMSVAVSHNHQFVVSGSIHHLVRIWNIRTGMQQQVIRGHTDRVTSTVFSTDDEYIASGSQDGTVRVWAARTGMQMHNLHNIYRHEGWVNCVAFSPDSQHVVSGHEDNAARIWSLATDRRLEALHGHGRGVCAVAFSPNGLAIVSGSADHTVRIWNITTVLQRRSLSYGQSVASMVFSHDGQLVAAGFRDGMVRGRDRTNIVRLPEYVHIGHGDQIECVAFSPDGQTIVSGARDKTVRVWDANTGLTVDVVSGHRDTVCCVAFSHCGQFIMAGSYNHQVLVWDAKTGAKQHDISIHHPGSKISTIALSPDKQFIDVQFDDHTISSWNAVTGTPAGGYFEPGGILPERLLRQSEYALDNETGWISRLDLGQARERICWLPVDVRGDFAFWGHRVCIGSRGGSITILDFSDVVYV
jgi:WD40 repeat protein